MSNPLACLISDTHYSLSTLELADNAFRQAIDKAAELHVPLIDCGDLTNDKDILRGQVMNRLIATMQYAKEKQVPVYLLVGNHSLVNEKGKEHVLNFLKPHVDSIIDEPRVMDFEMDSKDFFVGFIPYQSNPEEFSKALNYCSRSVSFIIAHQGVEGSHTGDYVQDKSALPKEAFKDFRVISGHYHRRQDIKCGPPRKGAVGLFSYVGNPFSLTFGEAGDGPKGFQILNDDGTLTFVPTNLRKHVVMNATADEHGIRYQSIVDLKPNDLLWLKVTGAPSDLVKIDKKKIGEVLLGHSNFKLDLIPTEGVEVEEREKIKITEDVLMDEIVDASGETTEEKSNLKGLWRTLVS